MAADAGSITINIKPENLTDLNVSITNFSGGNDVYILNDFEVYNGWLKKTIEYPDNGNTILSVSSSGYKTHSETIPYRTTGDLYITLEKDISNKNYLPERNNQKYVLKNNQNKSFMLSRKI